MAKVGQIERKTQERVIALLQGELGYAYLGNWEERDDNRNIETELLLAWLKAQGHDEGIANRAIRELERAANDQTQSLYDRNKAVYGLLRYGVKVKPEAGEKTVTIPLVNWEEPERNHFAMAEEVTVLGASAKASTKRPDLVIYLNGIAVAVIELKRSSVSVDEGIRQNLDNQKPEFIAPFFATIQWVVAGNDTEGLRYGTSGTPAKQFLEWKEGALTGNPLDRALRQLFGKPRFLELLHDFVVFDSGIKKLCRHNQYFGVKAAQPFALRREGGIIWHSQGSGKSLTMVWLAKWIREHVRDPRLLIVTDRTELDQQIEKVFKGVDEEIYRTKSGADLIARLNDTTPWLLCSLIHKFGVREGADDEKAYQAWLEELKAALPAGFRVKGNLFVFVDECHRTQSGQLHKAMKAILPDATFIGFTGTPLLREDKQRSVEIFGPYIHTYKFNEAVRDGVVLDLRYEARDIDQRIVAQDKIDQWFEAKTRELTPLAKAQLKQRWGTMRKLLSSRDRLEKIVADIMLDFATRDRLMSGRGNAMLVAGSIYEACKYYELFAGTDLAGKCAIVTSYQPTPADIKGEESGEGLTERLDQYEIYRKMLAKWFDQPEEQAMGRVEEFEKIVKKKFIEEPGQMRLLIVVDKLLTGFDAPPATYLYIDKKMQDHGLFQAICRVNRLDGEDKDYGYIVDYKDLFKSLEGAVKDYTSGALDGYDRADVAGLLENRLEKAKQHLEESLEAVRALCEPVAPPRELEDHLRFFSSAESGNGAQLKESEPRRLALYKLTATLIRAYAAIANEMADAGFSESEAQAIKRQVGWFASLRDEVKLHSGDLIDLKSYEPAMRHLIDSYIRAEESRKLSAFDDLSLVTLILERGEKALEMLPDGLRNKRDLAAETIENNIRRLIIDESPVNPKYYERMSELLDALIRQRRDEAIDYEAYLKKIVELTRQVKTPGGGNHYPAALSSGALKALYDNLGGDESLAIAVDGALQQVRQDDWRSNPIKTRKVRAAIKQALMGAASKEPLAAYDGTQPQAQAGTGESLEARLDRILELVKNQPEY